MAQISTEVPGDERGTLLAFVEAQRVALREAAQGLTEEQAASRPSVSELSLSGLLKHAAECELSWLRLAQQAPGGTSQTESGGERQRSEESWGDAFRLVEGESVPGVLAFWDGVVRETEAFIAAVPSLDDTFPLPPAPWFPENGKVSMRWMLLHLVEEFARHAGHADIIRESLDGTRAMG
ncbi:DinB family protein [Streptomyces sp. NRRL F-2580]|uniref:DinB family protein n=1 Tax=Streptomyces sp. NRRL F-2580 TaxID=1463841 RepID=UPI0004C69D8C|nr:DinB family protein [Streptomyces sp. NRRL F-2580]